MKKLLSILMLLVAIVTGAKADTTYDSTPLVSADFSGMSDGTPAAISGVAYHAATISSGKLTWGGNWSEGSRDVQVTFTITGDACKLVLGHVTSSSTMAIKGKLIKGSTTISDFTGSAWSIDKSKTSDTKEFTGLSAGEYTLKLGPSGQSARSVITSIAIYNGSSGSSKTASECAFATTAPAISFPGTATYTQEATTVEGYDGTVTYALSNNTCGASINETTHEVTVTQEGSVTVTATASETDNYASSSASYTLTVNDTRTNLTGAWSANPTFDKGATPTIPTFDVTGGTKGTDYTVAYAVVSDANNILTVDANDGITAINTANPGIATVKATITVVNTAEYKAATTEYTCTVTVNNVLEAVSDYTWDFTDATEFTDAASADHTYTAETYVNNVMIGNGAQLIKKTGDADNQIQRLKLNQQGSESGYYVKIKVAAHSKVTVNTVGGSSRKIYFAENQVGGTKLAELDCGSTRGDKVLEDSGEGEKVICIYNSASGNITLYSITVEPAPREITLSSTDGKTKGFATFCGAQNFTVSGATAYKASINEDKIVLTTVGNADAVIPANNGIIIAGEKGATATVTFTNDEVTANMTGNSLAGTTARVATSTLKDAADDKVVGFFKSSSAFKSYTGDFFPANLAYFVIPASSATHSFDIVFDGETAINNVNANDNANSAAPVKVVKNGQLFIGNFNIAGQQVK